MLRQISQFTLHKAIFLSLLSGIILTLPYINGNLWIFSWIGFIPLFFALKNKTRMQAFLLSYLTGIIFWSGTAWWLVHVTLIGTILLILYLALYFGLFGLLVSTSLLSTTYSLLFISSAWVLLEYLRSYLLTGFPWALLGYSQYLNVPIIQIADITGAWGVSFLIMMVNAAIYLALTKKQKRVIILSILCLLLSLGYGYYKMRYLSKNTGLRPVRISVVQGNIPQDLKWERQSRDFIIGRYINLTLEAVKDKPDLIIWPEASLPVVVEEEPFYYERVKDLVKQIKIPLLLGAVTLRDGRYYNSALLISSDAKNLDIYNKLHLVPFGEYIPLKKILGFLETVVPIGEITPGKDYKVFGNPAKFSVLICFEDLFPVLSRRFVKEGTGILVNITNDAWYKVSPAPYQHLQASVLRAVENRVSLVRAANTGISCFITPKGEIISYVADKSGRNIFVTGWVTQTVYVGKQGLSIYTQLGDVFILFLFILAAYGIIPQAFRMKKLFLFLLFALLVYLTASIYFLDKYYFLCPVEYQGDIMIRSDSKGNGLFASSRKGNRMHRGLDLFAEVGTPVFASRSGMVVVNTDEKEGMGKYVVIRHPGKLITLYGHLSEIYVRKYELVRQGALIGRVGKTGNARSSAIQPHLHFEVRKKGLPEDPLDYLRGS